MLSWLTAVLDDATDNNERVMLMYHVPSGYALGFESAVKRVHFFFT